jgi:alkanesulfonate monooxygenase SsuD/methylene tetrahydromethanopterin reductase-like flavin-dependent oxidoreductase (luciferase family)
VLPDRAPPSGVPFELRPAIASPVAMLAVGSSGQTLEWIARHAIGWATYHRPPEVQRDRHRLWRHAVERAVPGAFRSFSVAVRIDLVEADGAPEPIELGYRTGVKGLRPILERLRDDGVHHVMLNLAPSARPPGEALEAIAEALLPAL